MAAAVRLHEQLIGVHAKCNGEAGRAGEAQRESVTII
jgi:hypothetical protein